MTAASNGPDQGVTAGQAAVAGTGPIPGPPGRARPQPGPPAQRPAGTGQPAENGSAAGRDPRARLLEGGELQAMVARWRELQAHFVDEPQTAVERADALVADLTQQLASMFARERAELERRWAGGQDVSTEELRQSLRRYRALFERLLAA